MKLIQKNHTIDKQYTLPLAGCFLIHPEWDSERGLNET
jgi:hypothetical protein